MKSQLWPASIVISVVILFGCSSRSPLEKGYCNVERVATRDRRETSELLDKHPKWTMDALKTIADLEHEINDCRGYQEYR